MRLSRFCADVARFQMKHGRLVVVENPYGSEMWHLLFWKSILDMQGIYAVKVQMCAAGLRDPHRPELLHPEGHLDCRENQEILNL